MKRTRQRVLVLEDLAQVQDPKIRRCWRPFVLPLCEYHKPEGVSMCGRTRGTGNREKPGLDICARKLRREEEKGGRGGCMHVLPFYGSEAAVAQA